MDWILGLDRQFFLIINTQLTSPYLDVFMPYVTQKFNFFGLSVLIGAVLMLILGGKRERWGILLLVLAVLLADFLCAELKDVVGRVRPCRSIEGARVLTGCGDSFSFPSGHATNIFTAMVFMTARYRRYWFAFVPVAFIIAYSRVYVGVHYPLDVIGGAFLGSGVAMAFYQGEKLVIRKKLATVLNQYLARRRSGF